MTNPAGSPESPLAVTLADLPDHEASFDGTLQFTVELANPTPEPVSLDPCPVLRATYGEGGTVVHFENELNCPRAPGSIPPGDHLRFAVEMQIPKEKIFPGFPHGLNVSIKLGDGSVSGQTYRAPSE